MTWSETAGLSNDEGFDVDTGIQRVFLDMISGNKLELPYSKLPYHDLLEFAHLLIEGFNAAIMQHPNDLQEVEKNIDALVYSPGLQPFASHLDRVWHWVNDNANESGFAHVRRFLIAVTESFNETAAMLGQEVPFETTLDDEAADDSELR